MRFTLTVKTPSGVPSTFLGKSAKHTELAELRQVWEAERILKNLLGIDIKVDIEDVKASSILTNSLKRKSRKK